MNKWCMIGVLSVSYVINVVMYNATGDVVYLIPAATCHAGAVAVLIMKVCYEEVTG